MNRWQTGTFMRYCKRTSYKIDLINRVPDHFPRKLQSQGFSTKTTPINVNPLKEYLKYVQPGPHIFKEEDFLFEPTEDEIKAAVKLFEPGWKHRIEFFKGSYYPKDAPTYNLSEVAFIGRSNVGKSSLIKSLFAREQNIRIRTSKTPGLTKLLLFYKAGKAFSLVDMPGYGFNQPENFTETVEGFLQSRKNLRLTYLLIDSLVGLQPMDFVAVEMLEEFSVPYCIVLTKSDKGSKRSIIQALMAVKNVMETKTTCCLPQPFLVSAHSMSGIPLLQAYIAYITGNLQVTEDR